MENLNQCDGCQAGMYLDNGMHRDKDGHPVMACQEHRYKRDSPLKLIGTLPNGFGLFVKDDEVGGREYWSDEIPTGILIWQTSLVDESSLLAAITEEHRARVADYHAHEKSRRSKA